MIGIAYAFFFLFNLKEYSYYLMLRNESTLFLHFLLFRTAKTLS